MNDNFYVEDLLLSVRADTVVERYMPLAPIRDDLLALVRKNGIRFRDEVGEDLVGQIASLYGEATARLFSRLLHLYDFNPHKLCEIESYEGTDAYGTLADLLRLPGVRILRAELYYRSGVTLLTLAERSTEEIREAVRAFVERENRSETVPLPKEVNCHRAVATMILHADAR